MTQLISPQGSVVTVAESQVKALVRIGWKRPADPEKSEDLPQPKPAAKRGRPKKSE